MEPASLVTEYDGHSSVLQGGIVGLPVMSSRVVRPRVVHVTTAHPADDVRIFERECRSLAASSRYDVYLAAAGSIPVDSGVTLIPFAQAPASRLGRFSSGPRKAIGLSRALSADLWHFHDPELLPVALKLARSGTPVIWDAHEDYVAQFSEEGGKNWVPGPVRGVVRRGMKAMLEGVDRKAAGVVAATPTIASRYANSQTVVVGNEARLEIFAHCTPDFTTRRILFTGNVGPAHLFDAIVDAVVTIPDVTLAIAGRKPDVGVWAAAEARLGDRIMHLGWLDRLGVASAINGAALGLSTYADIPTNSENSPNKLFEFCAAGLPVIASPNASNVRFIRESGGGFLADGFSPDAIARVIRTALSDQAAWRLASTRGREWATRVGSWELSERHLLDLYQQILGV